MAHSKKVSAPTIIDPNQRFTLSEGCAALRQSAAKTFADIKSGKLRVIKDGRRTYIPGTELIRLSRLPDQSAA